VFAPSSLVAIAAASNLPADEVELLAMRALSLKPIRGLIDQVDGTLRVTWVPPRVLQPAQIGLTKERLGTTWCSTTP
jgi:26S proteasome regulatory subunit N9